VRPGFKREELRARYDVPSLDEDRWHAYSGEKTAGIIEHYLRGSAPPSLWLLNAGCGVYELALDAWKEVSVDLFTRPIGGRLRSICASVEQLPFRSKAFGGVVCVGEVLAYCDPAAAIAEFGRVLSQSGVLICDFASSRSIRYWFRKPYGRAADLIRDEYNGTPERTWVYDPQYVSSLLGASGFRLMASVGTHSWSALARRLGASPRSAVFLQRSLEWLDLPTRWADLTTIVAERT
jgi:SAM-dependent methyltransferase